ncbi:MAG: phenylalanine--tRNA ligase subunit beta [Phycisphaerales bacterium]
MLISVRWLSEYLDGGAPSVEALEDALTRAGFPVEGREDLPSGDTVLDVEVTSNRGDCLCHGGLAREAAAALGVGLKVPNAPFDPMTGPAGAGETAADACTIENTVPDECPRFTARIIRGVTVGPSPEWLRTRLEAIGVKSINNLVDLSNYLLFELGQPNHLFDLDALAGNRLTIRYAKQGEKVVGLDDKEHALRPEDVCIADGERVVSIAGVIGGRATAVSAKTTNILLEAATWTPSSVRRTSRRLKIVTDAGKRYERLVDQRQIDAAAARLAHLVTEVAGGAVLPGVVVTPDALPARATVRMRCQRCRDILGIPLESTRMAECLGALDIEARLDMGADALDCTIPANRPDLVREIDLIEEVARTNGLDELPILPTIAVEVKPTQQDRIALRELAGALTGAGFYETVTFSFVTHDEAAAYMPRGLKTVAVDEERRKGAPALRPSAIPSLLRCRKANQDAGVERPGGLRFFETAAVFAQDEKGKSVEHRNVALLADAPDAQEGVRAMRAAVEAAVRALGGLHATVTVEASPAHCPAFRDDAFARLSVNGVGAGYMGLVAQQQLDAHDVRTAQVACEVNLDALLGLYPPRATVTPLPAFPAIERDLSVVVDESVSWAQIAAVVETVDPALLTGVAFVGAYRGKQVGAGKKSLTLRLRFLDPTRTLRHEEVDPQVEQVVGALTSELQASLRA